MSLQELQVVYGSSGNLANGIVLTALLRGRIRRRTSIQRISGAPLDTTLRWGATAIISSRVS
ncbi:hypothetical protein N657DRAFT_649975 [Parathielavia appendiculata]|uniref:Uncharacterized protein n=1 Tax=Parathielavia appendiculata TaxID=2587402 RepID=A0AAN6TS48_9PEZI|nr:hypothetical protein N657DRAFT_649975 [Parathielavia appendiculata]